MEGFVIRYSIGFLSVLAALVALPLGATAQDADEGATSKPNLQEPGTSAEPAPEDRALQIELDEVGAEIVEMQRRVRNAKIGLGISGVSVLVAGVLLAITLDEGVFSDDPNRQNTARDDRIAIAGMTLVAGGLVSMLTTGVLLGVRKRKLQSQKRKQRELQRNLPLGARGARPASASTMVAPGMANAFEVQPRARRVQWDLARSRLVF